MFRAILYKLCTICLPNVRLYFISVSLNRKYNTGLLTWFPICSTAFGNLDISSIIYLIKITLTNCKCVQRSKRNQSCSGITTKVHVSIHFLYGSNMSIPFRCSAYTIYTNAISIGKTISFNDCSIYWLKLTILDNIKIGLNIKFLLFAIQSILFDFDNRQDRVVIRGCSHRGLYITRCTSEIEITKFKNAKI